MDILKKKPELIIPIIKKKSFNDLKNELTEILTNMEWMTNRTRKNIMQKGQTSYKGFVLGKVRTRFVKIEDSVVDSAHMKRNKYKIIYAYAEQLIKRKLPRFKWNAIQFNRNQAMRRHVDAYNNEKSAIIGLGNYTGGTTSFYNKMEDKKPMISFDIRNKFVKFYGQIPHQSNKFKGNRISLVYYHIDNKKFGKQKERMEKHIRDFKKKHNLGAGISKEQIHRYLYQAHYGGLKH